MKKVLLSLSIAIALYGCQATVKMFTGITDPKIENEASVTAYMNKNNMETDNAVTIDTAVYLATWKRNQSSIPEGEIFDNKGRNLEYKDAGKDCNAGVFSFVPGLSKDTIYKTKDDFSLSTLLGQLRDFKGNKITPVTDDYDFYFFIYWAKWTGKLNRDHVMAWEKLATSNKNVKIKVFKVDLDFQEWWGKEFTDHVISKMSKKKTS